METIIKGGEVMTLTIEELTKKHFEGMAKRGGWAEMLYHTENRWGDWKALSQEEQTRYVRAVITIMTSDDRARRGVSLYALLFSDQVQIFYTIAKPFRKLVRRLRALRIDQCIKPS